MKAYPKWMRWLPWIILLALSLLWLSRWPSFPLAIDPYYHLLISRQIVDANGPITYEWWEYAPVGRVHIYPPLLHIIIAGLLKLGCSPIVAIRIMSVLILPCVLLSIFLVMRRIFGYHAALGSLLISLVPFSWFIQISQTLASGIACIELLWLMASLHARRAVASACLLALLCYTHLGLFWIGLAFFCLSYAFGAVDKRLPAFWSMLGGLILGLPWLCRVIMHSHMLHVSWRYENENIDIALLCYVLALLGAWRAWKQGTSSRLLISLWLGFCLMAYPFTYRWLSGEGLLPIILLAGYALAWCGGAFKRMLGHSYGSLARMLLLWALIVISPTLLIHNPSVRLKWPDTAPFHLLNMDYVQRQALDVHLFVPPTEELSRKLTALSRSGEILWSNAPYAGGLIAVLAHRAMSMAMFYEMPPARQFDVIGSAHLIVWFKILPLPGTPALAQLVRQYNLERVAEDDIAYIFRNPQAHQLARPPVAVISFGLAFVLLCMLIGMVIFDFRRQSAIS